MVLQEGTPCSVYRKQLFQDGSAQWSVADCRQISAPCHADLSTGCLGVLMICGWHPPKWAVHVVFKVTLPGARWCQSGGQVGSFTDAHAPKFVPLQNSTSITSHVEHENARNFPFRGGVRINKERQHRPS